MKHSQVIYAQTGAYPELPKRASVYRRTFETLFTALQVRARAPLPIR